MLLCAFIPSALADAPLEDRRAAARAEVGARPDDPQTWIVQAGVHLEDADYDAAIAAYQKAARFGARVDDIDTAIAVVLVKAGMTKSAAASLDRIVARSPNFPPARIERARLHHAAGDAAAAADDLSIALATAKYARPHLVLEAMEIYVLAGRQDEALKIADRAMQERGPVVSLQFPAIEIELSLQRHDAALARIDALLADKNTHPLWLQRRGEILEQADRNSEARESYEQALAEIEKRKNLRRGQRLALLEKELRDRLAGTQENTGDNPR